MALSSSALTTLARLKAYLDLGTTTAAQDAVLESIINSASDFIENYTGRTFKQTAHSNELYDGHGKQTLLLRNYPVAKSPAVDLDRRNSVENENDWTDIDADQYFVDYDEGIISYPVTSRTGDGPKFDYGSKRYRVSYTAGYLLPQDGGYTEGGATSLPNDIEYACWKLSGLAWNQRRGDANVESERIGIYSVKYTQAAWEDPDIKAILDKYTRVDYEFGL